MRHQYLMIDSRGNPVAHGTSDDGLEKSVWEIQVDSGDIKRVLSHEYVSLVSSWKKFRRWRDGSSAGWKYHLSRVGPKAGRRCAAQPADAGPV